ncbi:hypothetical protein ABK040_005508 [Willaertia magna]
MKIEQTLEHDDIMEDEEVVEQKQQSQRYIPPNVNDIISTTFEIDPIPSIILRACDSNTNWNMDELDQLTKNFQLMYNIGTKRTKKLIEQIKKIDKELETTTTISTTSVNSNTANNSNNNQSNSVPIATNSSNNPLNNSNNNNASTKKRKYNDQDVEDSSSVDEEESNNNDNNNNNLNNNIITINNANKAMTARVCGAKTLSGDPCKRIGFCPIHAKLKSNSWEKYTKRSFRSNNVNNNNKANNILEGTTSNVLLSNNSLNVLGGSNSTSRPIVSSSLKERQQQIQVSVLLVAAAALDRQSLNEATTTTTTTIGTSGSSIGSGSNTSNLNVGGLTSSAPITTEKIINPTTMRTTPALASLITGGSSNVSTMLNNPINNPTSTTSIPSSLTPSPSSSIVSSTNVLGGVTPSIMGGNVFSNNSLFNYNQTPTNLNSDQQQQISTSLLPEVPPLSKPNHDIHHTLQLPTPAFTTVDNFPRPSSIPLYNTGEDFPTMQHTATVAAYNRSSPINHPTFTLPPLSALANQPPPQTDLFTSNSSSGNPQQTSSHFQPFT